LALALVAICCTHRPSSAGEEKGEKPSEAGAAFGWWAMARTFPDGRFHTEKYEQAMAQMRLETQLRGGPVWEAIGPKNIGGRTLCIALHPQDTNLMWAGSASGGIWRSNTAGRGAEAWQRVETGFPVLGVSALAIDPTDPKVLYAGTGEVYNLENSAPNVAVRTTRGTYGIGILKTEDGGATWKKSLDWAYGDLRGVQDIQLNPLRPATVYAATTEGLLRSYDAGKTWKTVHGLSMAVDIALHPTDTNRVFVTHGSLDDNAVSGIYRSTDGGKTFQKLAGGLPATYTGKTLVSICKNTPSVLYASVGNSFNQAGLFRSVNGGDTWTKASSQDVCTYQGWYSHDVSVHPDKPAEITWVGIDAWHSTNNGHERDAPLVLEQLVLRPRAGWRPRRPLGLRPRRHPPDSPLATRPEQGVLRHRRRHFCLLRRRSNFRGTQRRLPDSAVLRQLRQLDHRPAVGHRRYARQLDGHLLRPALLDAGVGRRRPVCGHPAGQ